MSRPLWTMPSDLVLRVAAAAVACVEKDIDDDAGWEFAHDELWEAASALRAAMNEPVMFGANRLDALRRAFPWLRSNKEAA